MSGIQILGILFALFMGYLTFLHQKRKEFTVKEYVAWIVLWAAFLGITIFPESLNVFVKEVLNLQRPIDFFIILGFMLVMGLIFHIYTVMRKIQNRTEEIVRKMAMEKRR
ncbi:MAG: DUF2304 domain-containing protein [Nanoarchaeota archaeon]